MAQPAAAKTVDQLLAQARAMLPDRLSPAEALHAQASGALLIDIREDDLQPGDTREIGDDPEGQRGQNDFGSGRQIQRPENVIEGHAAVRRGNGVLKKNGRPVPRSAV